MLPTRPTADGSLKLRGLLHQSGRLLRRGQLKKAFTNAQIVKEFAVRSGEAPDVAYGAQLLMARVHGSQAHFTFDAEAQHAAYALLDALERDGAPFGHEALALELSVVRTEVAVLTEDFASAKTQYAALLEKGDALSPELMARVRAGLAVAIAASESGAEALSSIRALRAGVFAAYAAGPATHREHGYLERSLVRTLLAEASVSEVDDPATALELAQRAKTISQEGELTVPLIESGLLLGRLSSQRGNYAIGLRLLYAALDDAEHVGHARHALALHTEIARAYQMIGNDAEADKHLRHVAEAAERYGLDGDLHFAAHALGCSAYRAARHEEAAVHFATALSAAQRRGDAVGHGAVLAEMGDLQAAAQNFEVARHYLEAARRRFAEAGAAPTAKTALLAARVALHDRDPGAALAAAGEARTLSKAARRPRITAAAIQCQSASHEALGNAAEALAAAREAADLLADLVTRHGERQLGDLDMRAALREREREIEKLTRENDLKGTLIAKNEEIARANADLLQANEELRQFAFVASHDLKEPLRQVGSYVSLLKRKLAADLDEDGRTYFGFVTEGVGRLNRLFDSLMHYTAVARLDKDVREVDLTRVVVSVRKEFDTSIRASGAELRYGALPTVQTGGQLLRHVMAALIDNALRFAREGVPPVVTIGVEERDGMFCVSVQDNGVGIPQAFQDKVFQLFQMLEAKSGNPGTGVGLAIAQKTVQRLGGRIWYEDNADGSPGVTFRFTLPMGVERSLRDGHRAGVEASGAQEAA